MALALAETDPGQRVGGDVAFTCVSSGKQAQAVVDEVHGTGAKALALRSYQADTGRAPALIDDVVTHFGGLDILVDNAAISVEQGRTVDDPDADTAALDRMHATHYLGVVAVVRAAARVLRAGGRVITVSSGLGSRVGAPGLADYAATKSGVERYTMGVARDLGPYRHDDAPEPRPGVVDRTRTVRPWRRCACGAGPGAGRRERPTSPKGAPARTARPGRPPSWRSRPRSLPGLRRGPTTRPRSRQTGRRPLLAVLPATS